MPQRRGEEGDESHGQVHEGHEAEDEYGGEHGHRELRQVLAEVDLELLHAFHHGEDHVARSGAGEVRGTEGGHTVVDGLAEYALDHRRRLVGGHGAPVIKRAAGDHRGRGEAEEGKDGARASALDDPGEEPAEEGEPRNACAHGEEAEQHGARDAQAYPACEGPETSVEVHERAPTQYTGPWDRGQDEGEWLSSPRRPRRFTLLHGREQKLFISGLLAQPRLGYHRSYAGVLHEGWPRALGRGAVRP